MLISIAVIIILILLALNVSYRLQIKEISRQIDFISNTNTNKIVTTNIKFKEVNDLVSKLNSLLAKQKEINQNISLKDKELREAITNISHDIRTPLTSLNGYFQLLIKSNDKESSERYISIIKNRINTLTVLLDDMFTYIKIQDGKYLENQEVLDINNLVKESLLSHYETFKLKEIEPTLNLPKEAITITANKISLNRIFNNLITNSLTYGSDFMSVNLYQENSIINIVFKNGVKNLENLDIENVFKRFYKTDHARTGDSSGLGLAIVKELVESMEGSICANIHNNNFTVHIKLKATYFTEDYGL